MFNPTIIIAIILQAIIAKFSRKAGAIIGFVITTGIFIWGLAAYGQGSYIEFFGFTLSLPIFIIVCLAWYGFDFMEFSKAQAGEMEIDQSEEGIPPTSRTKVQIPAIAIFFLWILTTILANIGWSLLFPAFVSLPPTIGYILLSLTCGLIAGLLQWQILVFLIPNASRKSLALWVPASMLGWGIINIIYAIIPNLIGMNIFLISLIRGGTIGLLQWLILKIYFKEAIWLIPANIIDFLAYLLILDFIFMNFSIPNMIIGNIIFGLFSSIATSIVIVYISKKDISDPNLDIGNSLT